MKRIWATSPAFGPDKQGCSLTFEETSDRIYGGIGNGLNGDIVRGRTYACSLLHGLSFGN